MSESWPTIVINLEHRTDRRADMQRQLSRVGWQAEFFPAVRPTSAEGFPSLGGRGCFLSHLEVIKKAHAAGAQRLLILEDDLNFVAEGFAEGWKAAMAALETMPWSIFYAGHVIPELPKGLIRLAPETGVLCTHFVMLNNNAFPTFIKGLETIKARPAGHPLGGPMQIDGAYSTIRAQNPALITYASSPSLGYQRPSRTDIADLKWFDRIEMLAPVLNVARKIKARI